MATPKKLHFKRNIGIAVAVIVILLIGVVSGFYVFNGSDSTSNPTPPSGAPLQTPTPTSTPTPTPTSTPITSLTPSPSPTTIQSIPTSPTGYYLLYGKNLIVDGNIEEQAGNVSEIFLVSANASYGNYPYPTVTGWAEALEPCVTINFTIRSDYSTQNPPPNPNPENPTSVYVFLTAQIFNGENQIDSTDITPPVGVSNFGAVALLNSGESATLTIYLATGNTNITSFQIDTRYVGGIAPP
jgi:hypothetical protein